MGTHPKPNVLTVGTCSVPISFTKGGVVVLLGDQHTRGHADRPGTLSGGTPTVLLLPQTELKVCVCSSQGDLRGQPARLPCHHHAHSVLS